MLQMFEHETENMGVISPVLSYACMRPNLVNNITNDSVGQSEKERLCSPSVC